MKTTNLSKHYQLYAALFVLFWAILPSTQAANIVWTNTSYIVYTKSAATPTDVIIPGVCELKRDSKGVLYNVAAGQTTYCEFPDESCPRNTGWAFGALSNYATLTYQTLSWYHDNEAGGNMQSFLVNGGDMVVAITNGADVVFMYLKFTTWGHGLTPTAGQVSYMRSPPNPVLPTVSITSPSEGDTFPAPASVHLSANATVSGGTVTNVEYFADSTSLGSATASPFNVTGNIAASGPYALTAVATAGGLSSTSAPVNITVTASSNFSLINPKIVGGIFSFQYNAISGDNYAILFSSNLVDWTSIITNLAGSSTESYSESAVGIPQRYFRVNHLSP